VNRLQWQRLTERRLKDAKALLTARCWSAAYYLAGYAVECGLKACVLARVGAAPEVIFADRRFSEKCWTHSIVELVRLADLQGERAAHAAANPTRKQNWVFVEEWSEEARYQTLSHSEAKKLHKAITDKQDGVMPWIRSHW
jgi:HEPN domain-containing protein